ncbi:ABC transporter substrate-binding protein [Bacillus sp. 03113]|uniref:ABC transporter substrate-binding protein n=1 Tax=Bacillus sp. 03113 TaxID=2578211 RepID=UPI0015E8CEF9|nr:ABC transporter substrate-binding protein [Bacillus sp. 03113]
MKKSLSFLLCLFVLILSACGSNSEGSSDQSEKSNEKLQKINLMLDWYPNAVHSFLFTAKEKGYFKEQGLDVELKMPADTNDPLKLVASKQIDIAISYQPQVVIARAEDIPVQSFGAIVRHPLNHLMVPADSSIQSPKDLAGKSIGYPSILLDEAIVDTMVKYSGGNPEQVKMVDVGWDLIPAIATKKTDALMGAYINHEKLLLEKEGHPIRTFNPTEFGVPDYYELVFVASEKGIKDKPELYKKFMTAAAKGQKYVQDHPEEGLSILMKHEDKTSPLEKDIETKSLEILLPLMDAKNQSFGYQDPAIWEGAAKWLYDSKVIKKEVKTEDAFVNF